MNKEKTMNIPAHLGPYILRKNTISQMIKRGLMIINQT